MQDPTMPRSGFAELNPIERRLAALEDHLRNETRSSQALAARVKELEALLKVLGVVPEYTPGTEPAFLPLADLHTMDTLAAQEQHDLGTWLVTAFQPGAVDEAAVLCPGGAYESAAAFCRRALQLAMDRGAFSKRRALFAAVCDDEQERDIRHINEQQKAHDASKGAK